jgi:hypothetical protein
MTCEEFERVLMDSNSGKASEGWMLRASRRDLVEAHVQNCPACATKMTEAAPLEDALDELRLSTRHIQAPAAVEEALLDAFHREVAKRRSVVRSTLPWRVVWLSAAAVALVTAGLLFFSRFGPSFPVTLENHATEAESRMPHSRADSGVIEKAPNENRGFATENPVSASRSRVSKTRKPKSGTVELRTPATLNDELSLNGGGSIVRVTLPLSSLTAMGLPVHADLSDPRVTADVWMDPFGDVMKVRLVAENRSPNQE